jgi:hypothetical protein
MPLACFVLALAALAVPVALVRMPPLLDYPNHFARIWLLAGGMDDPPLSSIYVTDWSDASTNIGVDLLAATLGRLIGGETLAELLLASALILPPLGAALLNRAVFGGWHWWQVGFALLAWNTTLLAGFLNFQVGLGLALLAAAADPAIGHRAGPLGGAVARVALGGALLVWHVFAAVFYGALIAGLAFGPDRAPFARAALRSAVAAVFGLAVPVGIFLLVAPVVPGGHAPPEAFQSWTAGYTLRNKLNVLRTAVLTYDQRVDVAFMLGLAVPIALAAIGWLVSAVPSLRAHAGLAIAALGLAGLAVLVPSEVSGTSFVDWRLPIMAALTGVAALRPDFRRHPRRLAPLAACALLLLALARTAWVAGIWRESQGDVAAVERVLARVPAGAAVLPTQHTPAYGTPAPRGRYFYFSIIPSYSHYPSLAVPWRRAFVPTLFATPGKQPLRVQAPWRSFATLEGETAPVHLLASFEPTPRAIYFYGFAERWREHFDYVLVVNADLPHVRGEPPLPELELVADEGFARLYRNPHARGGTPAGSPAPSGAREGG